MRLPSAPTRNSTARSSSIPLGSRDLKVPPPVRVPTNELTLLRDADRQSRDLKFYADRDTRSHGRQHSIRVSVLRKEVAQATRLCSERATESATFYTVLNDAVAAEQPIGRRKQFPSGRVALTNRIPD
jgi:hypothetical protein